MTEHSTAFSTKGYCVLPGVLSQADTDALRDAIGETMERVARALRTPLATSHLDAPLEERFDRIAAEDNAYAAALYHAVMADTQRDPRVIALGTHAGLTARIGELIAPLVRVGEVIRPRAAIPSYQSRRSPWHQDVTKPDDMREGLGAVRLACWMPLADVSADDGAIEVAPGAWAGPLPHDKNSTGQTSIPDEQLPPGERRTVPVKRGDVLILDRFIPHRSAPVTSGKARWAFVMWVKAKSPPPAA